MLVSATAARRRAIRRIIAGGTVESQIDLVELLAEAGFEVTQATVSRDLKEIGAFKARNEGGTTVYALSPLEGARDETRSRAALRRALSEFGETIVHTANLVVVTTPPGAAQVVAGAIDHSGLDGVLGTVAGDDTVLVVADDKVGGWRIAKRLEQIGEGR